MRFLTRAINRLLGHGRPKFRGSYLLPLELQFDPIAAALAWLIR
jgi:hypothetical protein